MRNIVMSIALVAIVGFVSCKNEGKKETKVTNEKEMAMSKASFGVRGNCGMCKSTIEKAANGVEGVTSANWDKNKKEIHVTFNDAKTSVEVVHKAIANSGYDTDKMSGSKESYQNLPGCCQYDNEMKMSLKNGETQETH
ncbi:Copper chaperone CopZ [Tenacibaculum sp. MAR_2009_124]|uniref:heavy-metal-associated domain-containing protein n=1 Tax=Tenacibaculum sp. MAR_2009_124 TaxID=1250059 RepID=UPI0008950881|nr:cation transporter [Tenacibaculum sp. MAR_2009_124]SEB87916.1 Copper chaperone CopZ [Tenacibaculum sp. MAR_2009_124]